jgi:long-chain acyl-CoA synthetase
MIGPASIEDGEGPLLSELLDHATRVRPHHVAVCDDRRALDYVELSDRVRRLTNALRDGLGLARGERFGMLSTNRAEFAEVYFSAACAGVTCVPLNYRLAAPEMTRMMADADARVLFVDRGLEEKAEQMQLEGFDGPLVWLETSELQQSDYEQLLSRASARPRGERCSTRDVVLQIYTSGTTGFPKGVMLSNRNLVSNSWHLLAESTTTREDRHLTTAPMCHLGAGSRVFLNVHAAATNVIRSRFDAEAAIRDFTDGTANTALIVPSMLRPLLDAAAGTEEPLHGKVRLLVYGAEPMPQELLAESLEALGCDFQQNYGLTESGPNLTMLPPADHLPDADGGYSERIASIGRETTGVRVRVVDEDDVDVPPGTVGEIIARGANVMEGYWNMPEATAEALRGGWLRTGDLAVVDAGNYIYLAGRKKDMLISGGFNVYPLEIERALEGHPGVAEIAVVGMHHERWGEVPAAFVVVAAGAESEQQVEAELRAMSEQRLASFKAPKLYTFVEQLPRNASGKVVKSELAERLGD